MAVPRRQVLTYAAVLAAVFGTIICAAEFQDTGAASGPLPMRTTTVTVHSSPSALDRDALERARSDARETQHRVMDDASRSATSWLAP